MAIHSRLLAWKIPWTEEPGRLQSMGSQLEWLCIWPKKTANHTEYHCVPRTLMVTTLKCAVWGRSQDGGGIRRGDHFLFYKFIERTTERWTKSTKQLLIASGGHQAPRKAAHCLQREVGQGYWRLKRETREQGTETRPGKGISIEEVSNHQETLVLAGPGGSFQILEGNLTGRRN